MHRYKHRHFPLHEKFLHSWNSATIILELLSSQPLHSNGFALVSSPPHPLTRRNVSRREAHAGWAQDYMCCATPFVYFDPSLIANLSEILNTNKTPTGMKAISQVIFNNKQLHPLAAMHFQWTVNTNEKHLAPFNFAVVSTGSHDLPGTMEGLYNYSLHILYNILATWKHSGNSRSGYQLEL